MATRNPNRSRRSAGVGARGEESIAASSTHALIAQLATASFTAILTLFLVRALGPSRYGLFALAVSIGALIALPADFGISSSTARFIAEHRGEDSHIAAMLADAVRLKLIASGAACGALVALAGPIAAAYDAPLTWPLRLVAVAVFGQNFMFLFEGAFVATARVRMNVRLMFSESAIECGTSIVIVLLGAGATGAAAGRAIGYCAGGVIALLLGARLFRWPMFLSRRNRPSSAGRIARYAVPLMLVDGANALFAMIDILLIGAFLGPRQVGLFSAPMRLLPLLGYPAAALATGVAPRMARGADHTPNGPAFNASLRALVLLQSVMLAPLVFWAEPLVRLFLGPRYAGSVETLQVLSISVYLGAFAPLVSLSANYLGDARSRVPLMIGAALLDTGIDLVLIPRIGIVSGAIATGAAYALMVAGHVVICRRHVAVPLRPLALSAARALAAAACMALLLLALGTNPSLPVLVFGLIAGTLLYIVALRVLREVSQHEMVQVRRWVRGRLGRQQRARSGGQINR